MPAGLFEAYVVAMDGLDAEAMLDQATANDYAGWSKSDRERWWNRQMRRIRALHEPSPVAGLPRHRSAVFFWNGQPIGSTPLRQQLAQALGGGFARD